MDPPLRDLGNFDIGNLLRRENLAWSWSDMRDKTCHGLPAESQESTDIIALDLADNQSQILAMLNLRVSNFLKGSKGLMHIIELCRGHISVLIPWCLRKQILIHH